MKNSNHVNWLTVKVYLSDSIGQQTSILDLLQYNLSAIERADLAWKLSSRQERPGDKAQNGGGPLKPLNTFREKHG